MTPITTRQGTDRFGLTTGTRVKQGQTCRHRAAGAAGVGLVQQPCQPHQPCFLQPLPPLELAATAAAVLACLLPESPS